MSCTPATPWGALARDNISNITNLHLVILAAAINKDRTFSIGALIARRHATNHGRGAIYGGVIASRLLAARHREPDPSDTQLPVKKLDLNFMKLHQFVSHGSQLDNMLYKIMFANDIVREVTLPDSCLFNYANRKGWSFSMHELDVYLRSLSFHADATKEQEDIRVEHTPYRYEEGSSHYYQDAATCSSQPHEPTYSTNDAPGWNPWSGFH